MKSKQEKQTWNASKKNKTKQSKTYNALGETFREEIHGLPGWGGAEFWIAKFGSFQLFPPAVALNSRH